MSAIDEIDAVWHRERATGIHRPTEFIDMLLTDARTDHDALLAELAAASESTSNTIPVEAHDRVVEQMNLLVYGLRATNKELLKQLDDARAELAEYLTLRPSKCRPECWRKGWDAAKEAAADLVIMSIDTCANMSAAIRALEPPADCGVECNPLEPDAAAVSISNLCAEKGHWFNAGGRRCVVCNAPRY